MKEYQINNPPVERRQVVNVVFDGHPIRLYTRDERVFFFHATSLKVLKDGAREAYCMNGKVKRGGSTELSDCSLLLKQNGEGTLTIMNPEINTVEQLMKLRDAQLQQIIEDSRRLGTSTSRTFQEKLGTLPRHEALVLEARATYKASQIPLFTELDLELYLIMNPNRLHPA